MIHGHKDIVSPPLTILNSRHVTDTKQKAIQNTNTNIIANTNIIWVQI